MGKIVFALIYLFSFTRRQVIPYMNEQNIQKEKGKKEKKIHKQIQKWSWVYMCVTVIHHYYMSLCRCIQPRYLNLKSAFM